MAYELNFYKGLSSVFGGFLVHITLGTFYTLGNVNTYLTSYLRKYVDSEANYAASIWINAAFMLGQGTLMILGGLLEARIGARWTVLIGSSVFSGSVALTYFTIKKGFWFVVLSYGFMASLGVGIAYVAPLAAGMKWFPRRKGLVNGITVGGFGLGALIFNQVQTAYLNPMNLPPSNDGYFEDDAILLRVPSMFILLGGVYFAIQIIGSLLIFKPPTQPDEIIFSDGRLLLVKSPQTPEHDGYSSCEDSSTGTETAERLRRQDFTPSEALRTNEFAKMWLMFALVTQGVQFVNTMYKAYGQQFIKSDHFLAFVGSVASIFNAGGRIAWGQFLDATSFRKAFFAMCTIFSLLMITLFITEATGSKLLYFIWISLIFFTFSGIFVIFPTATALVFGKSHAGTIYGMLFTAPALTSLIGAIIFQTIQTKLKWTGSFDAVAFLTILAMIVMLYFPSTKRNNSIN